MTSIELAGVGKRYRGITALDGIDLTLQPGITGLLGPNGAGKTTLLRILATVLAPDAGRVRLLGHDLDAADDRRAVRRRLGYLPQELGFPRDMTAFAFVDYMAVLKEWTDRRTRHHEVRRVLGLVDLTAHAGRKIRKLSGGQRRRVALAQALLGDPDLLVLDEPTTGLDPEQRATLRAVLSGVGTRATVVLATHQTDDVAALCDRVVVLHAGATRSDGTVRDLVATAAGRVWQADAPDPTARASWRTGTGRYRNVGGAGPGDLGVDARSAGTTPVEPTLEDAYLLLLGPDAAPAVENAS